MGVMEYDRTLTTHRGGDGTRDVYLERKLHIFTDRDPLIFAYKETFDHPEDHKLHIHQNYELYYFLEGEADYIVKNGYYTLAPGDLMLIKPGEMHSLVLKKPCFYKRFYMVIPNNIFSHHITNPLSPLLRRTGGASARLMLSPESSEQIKDMLFDIVNVCRAEPAGNGDLTHTKIYAKMLQLLCTLSEKCTSVQIAGEHINTSALPAPIKTVMPYIENNIARISSVGEIADAIHVSAPYLSAVFRKHIGVPLVSYLQARKIALAKQLLEEGRSVTYACYESGFSDCSYFIRIFKKHIGMTPLQYRNTFRGEGE